MTIIVIFLKTLQIKLGSTTYRSVYMNIWSALDCQTRCKLSNQRKSRIFSPQIYSLSSLLWQRNFYFMMKHLISLTSTHKLAEPRSMLYLKEPLSAITGGTRDLREPNQTSGSWLKRTSYHLILTCKTCAKGRYKTKRTIYTAFLQHNRHMTQIWILSSESVRAERKRYNRRFKYLKSGQTSQEVSKKFQNDTKLFWTDITIKRSASSTYRKSCAFLVSLRLLFYSIDELNL